jgi:hypothetical protein
VGAASSREKKLRYRHHHKIAAGSRSHNQNRINYQKLDCNEKFGTENFWHRIANGRAFGNL